MRKNKENKLIIKKETECYFVFVLDGIKYWKYNDDMI